ncbi:MAG: ankyrin repeat domain-containing protein [Armatimonadetes bacterium]|nr:ankyrin repeat domain-containing protein [Armatimonadota bacterium]
MEKIKAAVDAEPRLTKGYEQGGSQGTLLTIAAGSSKLEETVPMVVYLLEKGADVQADDYMGYSPLHGAAMAGMPR